MTQPDPDEGTTMWLMLEFGLTIEEVACLWDAPGPWGAESDGTEGSTATT